MPRSILILGASSPMAKAAAAAFAQQGDNLFLAEPVLAVAEREASDLAIRYGTEVYSGVFNADSPGEHGAFFASVLQAMGGLDGVVSAVGYMGDQQQARDNVNEIEATIQRNFTGVITILALCANHLEAQGKGFIIAISSVAGDRGRQSNYTYGAAKGGLTRYLEGLRNRLFHSGARVITVKPGFVDTEMTFGMDGLFLLAPPELVGRKIAEAPDRRSDTLYVPSIWRLIMLIIQHLPEFIFKRLNL
jgi:NAD(P)-dependent dehydrogenase (short-subunit alcohol dehydrogenase family)